MGLLDETGKELISRLVNRTGEHKDLYCKRCRSFTSHVSISHARFEEDLFKSRPERVFYWLTGKLNDINPIVNLIGRPYKCAKCGNEKLD